MRENQGIRRWAVTLLVGVVLIGLTATAWTRALAGKDDIPTRAELCAAYRVMANTLNTSPGTQNARIQAGSRLADLASRYPERALSNSEPVSAVPEQIRAVLDAPYSRVGELFSAARPIAVECDLDWRTGSATRN